MAKLKFYYNLLSQPCRVLYIFLKINKIPFEPKIVDFLKGEQFSPQFEAVNPLKKVPVIVDNKGFVLIESIAILRYICRTYDVPDHWYPKNSAKQARVDEYLEWQHTNTRANCSLYFLHKVFWPFVNGKPANEKRVARQEVDMINTLDSIENVWLKDKRFLCGNEISISDIVGICEIDQPRMAGFDPFANRANLFEWKTRVVSHLSPFYEEATEIVEENAIKYNKKHGQLNSKI